MPSTEWIESEVRAILPNCLVEVTDLTGGSDHFHVRVVDASFAGMRPLQRQKLTRVFREIELTAQGFEGFEDGSGTAKTRTSSF